MRALYLSNTTLFKFLSLLSFFLLLTIHCAQYKKKPDYIGYNSGDLILIPDHDGDDLDNKDDPDDDNDGINDLTDNGSSFLDQCPLGELDWTSDSSTDFDGDGCKDDSAEDLDDDNDGVADDIDEFDNNAHVSGLDTDGDDIDNAIDEDDDNDGVPDDIDLFPYDDTQAGDIDKDGINSLLDLCPNGERGWPSDSNTDRDGDGCRDESEDKDYDNDGVDDDEDLCPRGRIGWISEKKNDNDRDGCYDSEEDDDDDNDGLEDTHATEQEQYNEVSCSLLVDCDGDLLPDRDDEDPTDNTQAGNPDNDNYDSVEDIDDDNDGLIEIFTLEMLHNIRYNLQGSSYKTSPTDEGDNTGCPDSGCNGYELEADLDFDIDGDRSTFSGTCNVILANNKPRKDFNDCTIDTDDIVISYFPEMGWLPINSFSAIFEGNGHTISNLYSKHTNVFSLGLFGRTSSSSVIRNIGIVDNLLIASSLAGGLVGYNSGSIKNSYATGDVSSSSHAGAGGGGLVGWNSGGTIENSYATGSVSSSFSSSNSYAGGLVGYNSGSIKNSYTTSSVSSSSYAGGLVGWNSGSIKNSYATGSVFSSSSVSSSVGGLVGYNSGGTIENSYATGDVSSSSSSSSIGGLVGYNSGGTIENSYATGDVSSSSSAAAAAGGLVGYHSGSIKNSYATGDVSSSSSSSFVGGLIGYNSGSIKNSYATGDVSSSSSSFSSVGGLVGHNYEGTIENSYGDANADIISSTNNWDSAIWNFGNSSQFPGLCIGGKIHRPTYSSSVGFGVNSSEDCPSSDD